MAALNGTWKLLSVENFEEYLGAINVSSQDIPRALKLLTPENNITQEIEINGENIRIKTNTPVASSEVKAVCNNEIDVRALDGRETKAVYSVEDNQIIENVSGPYTAKIIRCLDGDNMKMNKTYAALTFYFTTWKKPQDCTTDYDLVQVMSCGDVTSTRTYEKV
ncbi:hypothetical protein LOTGIDRAFT_152943 [Lottia gigantea]|uniref:Cytosolic fatty-acid binding proteins domain-containing protein n=1 Tax=Lottia gigantea TaxID=225164 RepID=V4ASN1_LOTGI|nr:hypothetical protein LOTGIDRAFT_152943 [Lottia gigantea]ESO97840.1 hypothetical protein LOTGIDRAFT_152943 [Lottia gigantea]